MSMSDHIKQQVLQEFFCQKSLILLENGKTGFFCFTRVGEPFPAHILRYLIYLESRLRGTLF